MASGWGLARCMTMAAAFLFSATGFHGATASSANAAAMETGGITSQPIGHYEFCRRLPGECNSRTARLSPITLTQATWSMISSVNVAVNTRVKPVSDMDAYGKQEYWAYPDNNVGDCEDFALEKRRQLMKRGLSSSVLLITVVRKPDGEGHAVLTVRTDKGDYVLDNLVAQVLPWEQTGYTFLKRQAEDYPGRWVSIKGGSTPPLVGAVRSVSN